MFLFKGIKIVTVSLPIKDIYTIEKIKDLYIKKNSPRDLLLFELGINTGMNLKTLLKLRVKDVKNKYYLTDGTKTFPLNDSIRELIAEVIKNRNTEEYLFQCKAGNPLDRRTVFYLFKEICRELALPEEISVASWRKTFAYHHYKKYKDLSYLQWLFNQTTIGVTLKFIDVQENINLRYREGVVL